LVIVGVLSKRRGRALRTPTTPRPASASASAMTPTVRLSLNYCILRSPRGTPLRRNSLILTITSPRTKLPNSGRKRPSRRASRVQKRFLTAIFFHRGRRAIFSRGDTRSADGCGRNEPDWPLATLASCQYALRRCQGNGGSSTCSVTAISRTAIYGARARHSAKAAERLCL
jgi:hypothetical protein